MISSKNCFLNIQCVRICYHLKIFWYSNYPRRSLLKLCPRPFWHAPISWAFPIFLSHEKSRLTCIFPFPRRGINYFSKDPCVFLVRNIVFMRNIFAGLFYMPALQMFEASYFCAIHLPNFNTEAKFTLFLTSSSCDLALFLPHSSVSYSLSQLSCCLLFQRFPAWLYIGITGGLLSYIDSQDPWTPYLMNENLWGGAWVFVFFLKFPEWYQPLYILIFQGLMNPELNTISKVWSRAITFLILDTIGLSR